MSRPTGLRGRAGEPGTGWALRARLVLALVAVLLAMACGSALPALAAVPTSTAPGQNLQQAISDKAQSTTIAFSGLAVITGNLDAQSFFPPGKVADYWGFQHLRDNDPSDMGHNTSFLTRVACNVLYDLSDAQVAKLKTLAAGQVAQINQYGYQRYPLMQAFRRLVDGNLPSGTSGLDLAAVKSASKDLYVLDGQISYDRAVAYADILRSLSTDQKAYLDAMVGKGWASWPNKTMDDVRAKMAGLPADEAVAVMTYAGDLYSWYAGSVDADVYFCPERHGTYYGGFYIKDAPAIGHEGYSISEQLTATAGSALCDPAQGYVTADQAAIVNALVDVQRNNLYAGTQSIVQARTDISTALRSLISSTAPTDAFLAQVKATVLDRSAGYGQLDGEDNYHYATAFAALRKSLTAAQLTKLMTLRKSIMSGTYSDGTPFDFTVCTTPYLYSAAITDQSVLTPYLAKSDALFGTVTAPDAAFTFAPAAPQAGVAVRFTDASSGSPTAWAWTFGDGGTSAAQSPSHVYAAAGTYTVTLTVTGARGTDAATSTVTATPATPTITVTSPTPASSWTTGSTQSVAWTLSAAVSTGELHVGLVSSAGTLYLDKQVLPVAGRTAYSASLTVNVPAGTGYKAYVYWRPVVGSGACAATATSAAFIVTVFTPVITVTSPATAVSWKTGSTQTVTWSVNAAVPRGGEFRVGLVSSSGTTYVDKQVPPANGKTAYSVSFAVNVPAGIGYKAYVSWRPVAGSGAWAATATSAAITVTR